MYKLPNSKTPNIALNFQTNHSIMVKKRDYMAVANTASKSNSPRAKIIEKLFHSPIRNNSNDTSFEISSSVATT